MRLERLKQIVEAYGTKPERWPPHERKEALALMNRSVEAKTVLSEQAVLDQLLDNVPAGDVTHSLANAVLESAGVYVGSAQTAPVEENFIVKRIRHLKEIGHAAARDMLLDVDGIRWSGRTITGAAPLLGSAAALGLLMAVYAPSWIEEETTFTSESEIVVAVLGAPDFGLDTSALNGEQE